MARYTESQCRLCRRENLKLFLKGDRCYSDKCAMDRRPYPPGQRSRMRREFSEYGNQLREKQKVKRIYGVLERQFRNYFKKAEAKKGPPQAEWAKRREEMHKQFMEKYDKNEDGKIDDDEKKAARDEWMKRHRERN